MGRKVTKVVGSRDVYTTEEAARLLHTSRVSIHRWLVAGKLNAMKKTPGGHRRIAREELLRFAVSNQMDVPPQLQGAAAAAASPTGKTPRTVAASRPTSTSKGQARLLLVDDDVHLVNSLKQVLEARAQGRYTVSIAEDGFSALLRAIDELPDAILMDGVLFGMNGVQACRTLKANPKTKHIAIIAISGQPALEEQFREAGADAFMLKPFDTKVLVELLEALRVVPAKKAGYPARAPSRSQRVPQHL